MPTISQAKRAIEIQTPLGKDVLGLRSFRLEEKLGRPFLIEAEFSSEFADIKFEDITGHSVSIRMTAPDGHTRYFHGVVSRFVMEEQVEQLFHYRATIVPWVAMLSRSADCRMFQELSAPDIVQQVFRDRGFKDFELGISGSYSPLGYCIQYRETDLNFVSRLLEQEGIAYYYKHDDKKGTLVLADAQSSYNPAADYEKIEYWPTAGSGNYRAAMKTWRVENEVQPTSYTLNDYNFTKPTVSLLQVTEMGKTHGMNDRKIYDYPGEYLTAADGERLARIRLEELQVASATVRSETTCYGLSAGSTFTLQKHPRADQNAEHLVTGMSLVCDAGEFTADGETETRFFCEITAIPSGQPFRPARISPKPSITGPQPAVVVGPSGEEIHTDEHGRVKVHFFWDRENEANEKSSCWVRVAQGWAGKSWGALFLPRVGHEVLVEFIEGDPDRPIITGSVYNAVNIPPYALPGEKTKSTIKSSSSKGAGGSNEFRFEDKKGSEEVFLHAQKDLNTQVEETTTEKIGKDKVTMVTGKTTVHLKDEHHVHVVGNELAKFDADRSTTITGNRHDAIDGADHLAVKEDRMAKIDGADNLTVGKSLAIKAKEKATVETGEIHLKGSDAIALDGGKIHIKAGQTLILEAGSQLSLKVGGNFVDISSAGVNIIGSMMGINSGGSAGSGGGCSPLTPAEPEAPDPPVDPEEPEAPKASEKAEAEAKKAAIEPPPFSPAAFVLAKAAEDGTPFCEECAKAAEEEKAEDAAEIAVIESITLLDGDKALAGDGIQVVNLPKAATWVDATHGVTSQDRLGAKLKFKVKFNLPGAHPFKIMMAPGADNAVVSDAEKGRNAKFKFQDQEKAYTTDGDGTKTVTDDFFVNCCGLDTFKLIAEDPTNQVKLESPTLTVRRLVYYQPITMTGMPAVDFSTFSTEFGRHGIDLVGLTPKEIQAMPNIGSEADSNTYDQRVKGGFAASPGNAKKPHCVALGITGYLAYKNASKDLPEMAAAESGPDAAETTIQVPAQVANLVGGGMGLKSLWKDVVPGEGWFVSGTFEKAAGGTAPITEAMCTALHADGDDKDFRWINVDVTQLPAGGGTIKLKVNVVDRWRNGLSFGGGNLICIASKVLWRDRDVAEMNQTLIHEMGHKINMVCDGTGALPDAPAKRYTERGHVGPHCHNGLALADDFRTVTSGADCVMFGASVEGRPNTFCALCTPAVRKMEISAGFGG